MFKRLAIAFALVIALAMPAAAAEVNGIYGGIKFIDSIQTVWGTSDLSGSQSQNTVGGGIFIGYDFYHQHQFPLRAEIEYAIRTDVDTEIDTDGGRGNSIDANFGLQTLMANLYLDFHNSTAFTPYIGGGLGMGFIRTDYEFNDGARNFSKSETNTVFAWNVGLGCAYAFNDNISADLAYRYVGLGENEVKAWNAKLNTMGGAHEFSLGLRFTF